LKPNFSQKACSSLATGISSGLAAWYLNKTPESRTS
jgi:hypothetical protein